MSGQGQETPPAGSAAGLQAALTRALILRSRKERYHFLFAPHSAGGLIIRTLARSAAAPLAPTRKILEEKGEKVFSGAMLVDEESRCLFCVSEAPGEFLSALAGWAQRNVSEIPILIALADAGVAVSTADLDSNEAVLALAPTELSIVREPDLWKDLLRADVAGTASVLGLAWPGERLWYWLSGSDGAAPPLLLQPVAIDPNHERMEHLIREARGSGRSRGKTGTCLIVDAGNVQFRGPDLEPAGLYSLAAWVRQHVAAHPALARLSGCEFLATSGGRVASVVADANAWSGIERPPVPGTLEESARVFAGLAGDAGCWFWLTGAGPDGPFLDLADLQGDPAGESFAPRSARNYRRFAGSFEDAISGVLRLGADGQPVFVTHEPHVDHWPALMRELATRAKDIQPAFAAFGRAVLIQYAGEQVAQTLRATDGS